MTVNEQPVITWSEAEETCSAIWRSESGMAPPKKVLIADDRITADSAYRRVCEGTALLWRGDFQNARQLLQALARRIDRKPHKPRKAARSLPPSALPPGTAFHLHRQAQAQRARILGLLLLQFDDDYHLAHRRAPDVRQACSEAYGPASGPFVASLRELLGLIGAHEWRKKGVDIPALGERIHAHYGVFSPVRGEYIPLVVDTPLPLSMQNSDRPARAFDIGTGTGVLAAVLARRGIARIVATDRDQRALACARENMARLGLGGQVEVVQADLFPPGRASLIVCNPPWVPARASSPLESAVFDPDSRMLRGFLNGLAAHLELAGEGWLLLSDFAEHLGLRSRAELLAMIDAAGLKVVGRIDVRPQHPRVSDIDDPLHLARVAELTSLWRLAVR
jgi:methylase of polypeptide subunit release factors